MGYSGTCGKNLTWSLSNGKLLISGNGAMENYANSPAPWSFQRNFIKKIIIYDGVTSIGRGAFLECTSLAKITIPDSVTSIGEYAFSWCGSLTEITIPDGVTSIGEQAFYCCKSLTAITIPSSVKTIGNGTFSWCTSLRKIHYKAGSGFEAVLCYGNNAELIPYTPPVKKNFFVRRRHVESFAQPNPSKHTEWLGSMRTATDAVGEVIEILHALKKKSTNARR